MVNPDPTQPYQPPGPGVPPQSPPPYPGAPVPPPKKNRLSLILGIIVGAVLLCCGGGVGIALVAGNGNDRAAAPSGAAPSGRATTAEATASSPAPSTANTTTQAAPPTTEPASPRTPPAPAEVVYQGRGDKVVRLKKLPDDQLHFAVISHRGSSNFVITSLDSDGEDIDLIVNEIGSYQGTRPLDFEDTPVALKVEADGSWKITVKALEKAPTWPTKSSGKGSAVLLARSGSTGGFSTAKLTHTGKSNFVVIAYGDSSDLLVNEIGKYSGEVLLPSGTVAIVIEADGSWTMKPT